MDFLTKYVKKLEIKEGADAGYHDSVVHPANGEGRVGKRGINAKYDIVRVFELARTMDPKPNIILKAGPTAKWYFKIIPIQTLDEEIQKQQSWRDTSRSTMYVIEWK
jgi:hypothetical protein